MQNFSPGIEIHPYTSGYREEWDRFVLNSKSPHFFFMRDFMEYHSDRFEDASLLIRVKGRLLGILPANISGDTLHSHQGLTYGGILSNQKMTGDLMMQTFDRLHAYLLDKGLSKMVYKKMPHIYHSLPADEDLYCLHRVGAQLSRCELSSVIRTSARAGYSKGKKWNLTKAVKAGVRFEQSTNFEPFMRLLNTVLEGRHNTSSVHSLDEITYLAEKFPDNIRLFTALLNGEIVAGTLIFQNEQVVHTQYLANSEAGLEVGALDSLLDYLLREIYAETPFFSFGISTENGGRELNTGLLRSKEGFGARGIVHQTFEWVL